MGENTVVIQTKLGQLKGLSKQTSLSNKPYYGFYGVPFAKPPIEELRFKAPVPFGGWEGVRDALKDINMPKQAILVPIPGVDPNKVSDGDEDCLYLNVFINEIPGKRSSKKPVLVSIHGGGFAGGSGNSTFAGPDYLIEQDVVLVSFNYRCGAFGFLSLETEEVPGNAGLKDQILALQWVRDNIDSFGGDPDNVTIFGISAGGASVNYQLVSPQSKGLFHKAIIQSGYASNPWATQRNPKANAFQLAHALGCNSVNPALVLKFLQSVSSDEIVATTKRMSKSKNFMQSLGLVFCPCVEVAGSDPFLPDTPNNLLDKGEYNKVPIILGNCLKEGSVVQFFDGLNDQIIQSLNEDHELVVPSYYIPLKEGSSEKKEAAEAIWQYYMDGKPLSWESGNNYLKYQSDFLFNIGMLETRARLLKTSNRPVYTYVFSNHSRCFCPLFEKVFPNPEETAKLNNGETCHGADCGFLYTTTMFPSPSLTPEQVEAIKIHTKAWANFALSGDPNSKKTSTIWTQDSESHPSYMDIGETWVINKGIPFLDRFQFWTQLMTKYKPTS